MKDSLMQKTIPKGWSIKQIGDLLDFERPDNYIVESESYSSRNKTPVLTANKSFVLGYTNEDFGIYKNIPAIIFDDFTTDSKFVDFPFKVKSSAIKILKSKGEDFNLRFVYELMKSINFQIANHKRHYISQYQYLEVKVPPIEEQKKIVEILSAIDEEISKTDEIIFQTEKLKKGLMKEIFKNGHMVLLDAVAKRGSGHTPNKQHPEYWSGGIKWVSLADSSKLDNQYISETDKEISLQGIENSSAVLHKKNTIIVCRDAGIGKTAILGSDNMAVSQHFIAWQCGDELNFKYLYYWFQSQKNVLEQIATGTTIKTIGLSFFKKLQIPLFDIEKQRKISDTLSVIDEKILVNTKYRKALTKLKKGLMLDLLNGKVRVKPNK
jgi:type I restriction enzyme S subunit